MSLRERLRQVTPRQQSLMQLRNRHPGSEITHFAATTRYLALALQNEYGDQAQGWFPVDAWLEAMQVHLPEIPWQEVPLSYLASWINHLPVSFLLGETIWDATHIAPCASPLVGEVLSLPAEPAPLLCTDWPGAAPEAAFTPAITAEQLPFRMNIVLGYSQLSLTQLADVAPGDLLLIKQLFIHLAIGHKRLYRLRYHPNQEVIVEEQLNEQDDMYRNDDQPLHDWADLPVDIEFVLDGRTLTLRELDVIEPGFTLPLNADAEQNIKIYLNKTLFARGELVALENGELAVEISHVNPGLTGQMEEPDAE